MAVIQFNVYPTPHLSGKGPVSISRKHRNTPTIKDNQKDEQLLIKVKVKQDRKEYQREYQKLYHRLPKMVKYMHDYHSDPVRKAAAKKRRQTPEAKLKKNERDRKYRKTEKYKITRRKWMKKNRVKVQEYHRERYHANKNVEKQYKSKYYSYGVKNE